MTRGVKIGVLVLSQLAAFALTAALVFGYLTRRQIRTAMGNPLYRINLRLEKVHTRHPLPPLEDDLRATARRLRAPAPEVIRLMLHLRESDFARAGETCTRLDWPNCDVQSLQEMRKALE